MALHTEHSPPTTSKAAAHPPDPLGANHRTELASAWAGVVAVLLFVVGSLLAGSAPKPDASTRDVMSFLVQQRSPLLMGTALILLSVPFFGCFIGLLGGMLRDAEGGRAPLAGAATLGWTLLLAVASIGTLTQAALTWRGVAQSDAAIVRFVYDLGSLTLYAGTSTAVALSVGATSFIVFRSRMLPRWVAGLGVVVVLINVVELAGLASSAGENAAGYAAGVGPLVWALWVAATAIALARSLRRSSDAAGATAR